MIILLLSLNSITSRTSTEENTHNLFSKSCFEEVLPELSSVIFDVCCFSDSECHLRDFYWVSPGSEAGGRQQRYGFLHCHELCHADSELFWSVCKPPTKDLNTIYSINKSHKYIVVKRRKHFGLSFRTLPSLTHQTTSNHKFRLNGKHQYLATSTTLSSSKRSIFPSVTF